MIEIKNLRVEMGLSQKELADALSTTQRNVCNWETGKYEPDYKTLIKIAKFFDTTTDYLLGVENTAEIKDFSPLDKDLIAQIKRLSIDKKQALKILLKDF